MRRLPRLVPLGIGTLALGLTVSSVAAPAISEQSGSSSSHRASASTAARVTRLKVTRVIGGLDIPWDVKALPHGRLLIDERTTKRLLTWRRGHLRRIGFASSTVWARGETGLMGLAVDPKFDRNRRFYTCQGGNTSGGGHDVRVMAWKLGRKLRRAALIRSLLTGLPSTSGRHGGCRLLIISGGSMLVGTGDAATGTNPRNLGSLGGKVLRLNRFTGTPWPTNPYVHSGNRNARYVLNYGHRNVQGLSQRSDGTVWSIEQGTDRDDEVNQLVTGGDYGYNPVPGYNEAVPMTDQGLPGTQIAAKWRSGFPTRATSGGTWIRGKKWGLYNGMLAVATLKDSRMLFMRFDASGTFRYLLTPPALTRFGRLRSVTQLPRGDLLVTTSNGDGRDSVLRVHPQG
jgi:glucose/arabinose dehydrogenase